MNDEPDPAIRTAVRTLRPIGNVAVGIITAIAIAACSSDQSDDPAAATTSASQTVTTSAPSPTAIPTTVAPTTTVAPKSVSFPVSSANDIPVTFRSPEDWGVLEGWSTSSPDSGVGDGAFVLFDGSITNIYTDGCQWTLLDPPVGPTVDDLVGAWADVPELAATPPIDITVDGYPGQQIEFTVPDYTPSECKEQKFGVYMLDGAHPPGQWALSPGPNEHFQMLVLDVDGTRLLIAASTFQSTSPQDRADLEEVLASIQIG